MSGDSVILVLDLGTSRVKASVFAPDGRKLSQTSASYPTHIPKSGYAEQRPADWWEATGEAVRNLRDHGLNQSQVEVISVTGQMHGVIPLDWQGKTLGPCMTLRDRRAASEAALLRQNIGDERIYQISGARLDASSPSAKIMWYKRQSDFFESIQVIVTPKDWLRQQLTGGEYVTEPIDAAGLALYDVTQQRWSQQMCEACEIPLHCLPVIQSPLEIAGSLSSSAAEWLDLQPGCPVAIGAADDVEFIGAGLIHPGDCLEHLGSTGSLLIVVDQPVDDPTGTLELYPHLIPGRWISGGSTSNAGAALDWLQTALKKESALSVPLVNGISPPVFLPYLAGERCPIWQPDVRGVFWGLSLEHNQQDLVRAAFEGVAFSLKHLLEALIESSGLIPEEIRVALSDEKDWLDLRATVYERPLQVIRAQDLTALGAAMVGACAIGIYPDLATAIETTVISGDRISAQVSENLLSRYQAYLRISSLMQKSVT